MHVFRNAIGLLDKGMLVRALALLFAAVAISFAATMYFGQEVLIALGLILAQSKVLMKKVAGLELPAILLWLKTQASMFFRIELLKKWITTTLLPLLLGRALLRRIAAWTGQYRRALRARYMRLLRWYRKLHPAEKIIAALIILCATVALSVTSMGLWLVLFSVKLPLWFAAVFTAFGKMIWTTVQKMGFRAVAFLQLSLGWRVVQKILPASLLERKRRFDYRVARAVIRRRRMTVRQLADRKDSFPFRLGLIFEYWRGPKPKDGDQSDTGEP